MTPPDQQLPAEIGRYRAIRQIGRGAMGWVVLAQDPVLDRAVAIKLMRRDLAIPDDQRAPLVGRMRQEARASARVTHPNIVTLFDMGEDGELGLYLVFEHVDGATLAARLERGPLGPASVAEIAEQVGSALTTAHGASVLHRDIKPENILLSQHGAKIADFGIARLPDSTLTRSGGLLGTPAYSAPEAIAGGEFSPQSDQFSMAATLYEALSGRRAFPGDDAVAVASRIATEEPPAIAAVCGVDAHVDLILARALSKNVSARFGSCEEFGRALGEALRRNSRAAQVTLPDRLHGGLGGAHPRPRSSQAAMGGAAVGALLTIAGYQATAKLRAVTPPPVASALSPLPPTTDAPAVAWLEPRPVALPRRRAAAPAPDAGPADAATPDAEASQSRADAGSAGAVDAAAPVSSAVSAAPTRDAGAKP